MVRQRKKGIEALLQNIRRISTVTSELIRRITTFEDNFTERKLEGVKPEEIRRTLVAFANSIPESRTAVLFVGIADDSTIKGVTDADSLQMKVRRIAEEQCYPKVRVRMEVLEREGKAILAVEVLWSGEKPHFAGPAFIRVGSENRRASKEMYNDLIASRNSKAGVILSHKGQTISVVAVRKKLGSPEVINDSGYIARHECRVEACTALNVQLYDLGSGRKLSEPLKNVTVDNDNERHRLMLIVEPR